jgi:hypothetical protein
MKRANRSIMKVESIRPLKDFGSNRENDLVKTSRSSSVNIRLQEPINIFFRGSLRDIFVCFCLYVMVN